MKYTLWSAQALGFASVDQVRTAATSTVIPPDPNLVSALISDDRIAFENAQVVVRKNTPQKLAEDLFLENECVGNLGNSVFVADTITVQNVTSGRTGLLFALGIAKKQSSAIVGFLCDLPLAPGDIIVAECQTKRAKRISKGPRKRVA